MKLCTSLIWQLQFKTPEYFLRFVTRITSMTLGVAPLKQVGWSTKLCKPYKSHNSEITGLFVGQLFISPKKTRSVYDCNKRSAIWQILSLKTICFTFGCLYTHENTVFALPMVNSIHKDSMPFLLHSALTRRLWGISDLTYIMKPPLEDVLSCLNILYPCTSNCASGKLSSILDSLIVK